MKKLWLVLLSLGLIMAFSVSAFAVDVKVSAEYYAAGLYLNKVSVDSGYDDQQKREWEEPPSTAFYFQRLRMGVDFIVSPCLKLVTRFDAMERIWGGARSSGYGGRDDDDYYELSANSAGTRAENENIAFDLVYIDYIAPVGQFKVGYQLDRVWGTVFGDRANGNPAGQIQYWKSFGPATLFVGYAKEVDNSWSAVSVNYGINATRTDRDLDSYRLGAIYNFKTSQVMGETGVLFTYDRDATCRGKACDSYMSNIYIIDPYVKAKIGPVALQAEAQYWFGDAKKFEGYVTGEQNVSISALSVYLDATANFGMFTVGGSAAYLSGDDYGSEDTIGGGINTAGLDWNPCLILFNQDLLYWVGPITGHTVSVVNNEMSNAWFGQLRAGVKPTPQLDILLAVSYAQADKKNRNPYIDYNSTYPGGTYGTEIDLTGTYKITNNLTYMLGIGYLFTGDNFKGKDRAGEGYKIQDDFIVINKLTLTF
ncbi:hypothetical protein ASZ90_007159 [hydrocarbon metagenome]|uniref:Alginate export domain-containing protein n=1 Tax=hydrocarbon metagenome TaxID=938273 RepID=A0A0W8FQ53_9ZZZZ